MNVSIIGFLQAALSVLLLVHNNPAATPEMIQQALSTANQLVQIAQTAIVNESGVGGESGAGPTASGGGAATSGGDIGGPSVPASDVSIVATEGVDFPNGYRLQATGESFNVDTIVIAIGDRTKASPFVSVGMPLGKEGSGIVNHLHVFSCDAANYYTSSTLSYPCPVGGYVAVATDWQGTQRYNLTVAPEFSVTVEVPESGSLLYLHAIGKTTGKVVEKSL